MAEYLTNTSELTAVADAIRAKGSTTVSLSFPAGFVSAISAIETGGGVDAGMVGIIERTASSVTTSNVSKIGDYACLSNSTLQYVNMPNVTSVGSSAFYRCDNLTEVHLAGLTMTSYGAFARCSKLSVIDAPNIRGIENETFRSCSKLTSCSFPNATAVGENAFANCYLLQEITIPSVKTLGGNCFSQCSALSGIQLPNCTVMGNAAFRSCHHLLSVDLTLTSRVVRLSQAASYTFSSTPITGYTASTGGVYGSVYVPASLYDAYISNASWSGIADRIVSVGE